MVSHLEVVGQLGAAGVSGVHGDEAVAHHLERQDGALEHELGGVGSLGALDRQDLAGYHREHLQGEKLRLTPWAL